MRANSLAKICEVKQKDLQSQELLMFFALQHHVQLDMKASPLEVHEF